MQAIILVIPKSYFYAIFKEYKSTPYRKNSKVNGKVTETA